MNSLQYIQQQIVREEWYPKLFRLGNWEFKQPHKISDKNVINLLKTIKEEHKPFINAGFIIGHLKECPSAKRFNIFNKHLDFSRFTTEDKTSLIVWCFLLGRPPLLKRCVDTLWDEQVLELFPKKLLENCFQWNMNNNTSPNCKLLKEVLSENDFKFIRNALINATFHPCQTNINSIFNQSVEITDEFFEKHIRRKFFDFLHHSSASITIDFQNQEFYTFYSKYGYDKSVDSFIAVITESKSNKIEPFINYLENKGNLKNFFSMDKMDYTYLHLIDSFLDYDSSIVFKQFKNYLNILNRMPEDIFIANITNIIEKHSDKFNVDYIPDDIQIIFANTLNSRLRHCKIEIDDKNYKNMFETYCIFKQKETLDQSISSVNNTVFVKNNSNRL